MSKTDKLPRKRQMLCIQSVGAGILCTGQVYDVVDDNGGAMVMVILPNGIQVHVSRKNFEEN